MKHKLSDIVTLDIESHYAKDYSLSNKAMNTSGYIRDPRFYAQLIGIKDGTKKAVWYPHNEISKALKKYAVSTRPIMAHNCLTPDHEVLTPTGWVRFDCLTEDNEHVAQWDADTQFVSFTRYNLIRKQFRGKLLAWDSNYHQGVYTPEHRMYYGTTNRHDWRVATAQEVATFGPNNTFIPTSGRERVKLVSRPTEIEYAGDVFCVTVPTSAFLVRRNGAIWVTGNCAFDGLILAEHYDCVPPFYYDTLSMSRALHGVLGRNDLDTVAKLYGRPGKVKAAALKNVKGLRELPPDLEALLGEYCVDDTNDCFEIAKIQLAIFPDRELELIDWTIRAFCDSPLRVNQQLALEEYEEQVNRKAGLQLAANISPEVLQSAELFAEALTSLDVDPPRKISPSTGEFTWAFAKSDAAFKALLDHEDERVCALVEARLATKSTIGETRAKRFMDIGTDTLPVGLNYCAAHTTRWGGTNSMNLQNLLRGGRLRRAIEAPEGHVLCVVDSAQIEARKLAWFAGQDDLLNDFANGADIYSKFASEAVYYEPVDRKRKETAPDGTVTYPDFIKGFVGKVCLSEGTLVLCERGWVEIENVSATDRVWDGEEWVCHDNVVWNGWKPTLSLCGLWLTPDHLVSCGTQWLEAQYLERDEDTLYRALGTAVENLPWQGMSWAQEVASGRSLSNATVDSLSTPSRIRTSKTSKPLAATDAQNWQRAPIATGFTPKPCLTTYIAHVCSIVWQQLSLGAIPQPARYLSIMAGAASQFMSRGATIARNFSDMSRPLMVGTGLTWRWTEPMSTLGTSPEISASFPRATTQRTNVGLKTSKRGSHSSRRKTNVYDIVNAGPRRRFTVLTEKGPLIVHNCVLGLGYGMGPPKFQATLAIGALGGPPVFLELADCRRIVHQGYRGRYKQIPKLWELCDAILADMFLGRSGSYKCIEWEKDTIWLPNGLALHYHGMQGKLDRNDNLCDFTYLARRKPVHIWGGTLTENLIQALARISVGEQLLEIRNKIATFRKKSTEFTQVVMTTHDEIVACVPKRYAERTMELMITEMRRPMHWCPDMPFNAEGGYATNYSK